MNVKITASCMAVLTLIAGCNREDGDITLNRPASSMKQNKDNSAKTGITITNGISETEFKSVFGEPKGSITRGPKETLLYDTFQVALLNGTIIDIPENMNEICAKLNKPSPFEKLRKLPQQIPAPQELKEALAKRKSFTLLNSKSEPVDHTSLLTTGKVTVVEFFSDDLEACHLVNTALEELLHAYDQVELRTIEIDSWNSDIAKQYHINTVPDIRILDPYGFLVCQPVTRIEVVDDKIDLSRVQEALDKTFKH